MEPSVVHEHSYRLALVNRVQVVDELRETLLVDWTVVGMYELQTPFRRYSSDCCDVASEHVFLLNLNVRIPGTVFFEPHRPFCEHRLVNIDDRDRILKSGPKLLLDNSELFEVAYHRHGTSILVGADLLSLDAMLLVQPPKLQWIQPAIGELAMEKDTPLRQRLASPIDESLLVGQEINMLLVQFVVALWFALEATTSA